MLANIIYLTVFIILAFVTRGVEAKQIIKEEKNLDFNKESENQSLEIINQIKELKDLHDNGVLNDEEFKKAKDKLLK